MSFDWLKFYKIAEELRDNYGELAHYDGCQRTAINRLYYAAFNTSKYYLVNKRKVQFKRGKNVHQLVIDGFMSASGNENRTIGYNLNQLRDNRNKVDYQNDIGSNLKELTKFSFKLANQVIENVNILSE